MARLRTLLTAALLFSCGSLASANILLNPGFEEGNGADASDWIQEFGPSGSSSRSDAMPNTGSFGGYLQADHVNNPAAPTPYSFQQITPAGSIDDTLTYDLAFSAKVDSDDFTGFNMFYQVLWLDQDASHGGGVRGEFLTELVPLGLNTSYQQFGMTDLQVPVGTDSVHLRFQLSPGAVEGIANGLYIDDVSLATDTAPLIGDYNNDGAVDAADYTIWRDNVGTGFALSNRDPANSGNVSNEDYTSWVNNFGNPAGGISASAIPEPTGTCLLLTASLLASRVGSSRRNRD